jgi:hypothetical protein
MRKRKLTRRPVRGSRRSAVARRASIGALIAAIGLLAAVGTASAHHPGEGQSEDHRILVQADFDRAGWKLHRYDPKTDEYVIRRRPNEPLMRMHGDGDAEPSFPGSGTDWDLPEQEDAPRCASSGHRVVPVYSYPAGTSDQGVAHHVIKSVMRRMNWKVKSESSRSSGGNRTVEMLVDCYASGEMRVYNVQSTSNFVADVMTSVENALGRPAGAGSVKYAIFRRGTDPSGYAGYGAFTASTVKSASDGSDGSPHRTITGSALTYGDPGADSFWRDIVPLHELFHTMGAVQSAAPFGSPGAHCYDGIDLMCYDDDNDAVAPEFSRTHCPENGWNETAVGSPIDCNYNTYFDAQTESGEWLALNWNVGGSENPFLTSAPVGTPIPRWYLKNSNTAGGSSDIAFRYGTNGDVPVPGDWNNDGIDTPGIVHGGNVWHIRNSNTSGSGEASFTYGNPTGMKPFVGDWNSDGTDTPGMFAGGNWYLRNSNSSGVSDISFQYGTGTTNPAPITGDWNGNGSDTPGIRVAQNWYLRNSNTSGVSEISFGYGNQTGHIPLKGDWDGNGTDTPGVYDTATRTFYLRNSNTAGVANVSFVYGDPGDIPVTGDWNGDGVDTVGVVREEAF